MTNYKNIINTVIKPSILLKQKSTCGTIFLGRDSLCKGDCMITWNPWKGCRKCSEGCRFCVSQRTVKKKGVEELVFEKTREFEAPIEKDKNNEYKIPSGELVCVAIDDPVEHHRQRIRLEFDRSARFGIEPEHRPFGSLVFGEGERKHEIIARIVQIERHAVVGILFHFDPRIRQRIARLRFGHGDIVRMGGDR